MNLTRKTFSGMIWKSLSVSIQTILRIVVLVIFARLLTAEDFGLFTMATIFVGIAEMISQFGVGPALVQKDQLSPNHIRVGITIAILTGILATYILWLAAPFIGDFFQTRNLVILVRVTSLSFLFSSIGVVSESLLWRNLEFKKLMWIDLSSYFIGYILIGIGLAWSGYGVWALVFAAISQSIIRSFVLVITKPVSFLPSFSVKELKELLYFGSGMTVTRIFNYAAAQGDNLVIGRWLGSDALGLYGRAYQIMVVPAQSLGEVLDRVLFSATSQIQNNREKLKRVYYRGASIVSLTTLPLTVFLFLNAREIVLVFLGIKWLAVTTPLRILSFGMFFRTSYKVSQSLLLGAGKVHSIAFAQIVYALAIVSGALIGSKRGLSGVALGVSLAIMIVYIMLASFSLRLIEAPWSEYFRVQLNGLLLALPVAIVCIPIGMFMNSLQAPAVLVLVSSGLLSFGVVFLIILSTPKALGTHGQWAANLLLSYFPLKYKLIGYLKVKFSDQLVEDL